VLFVVAKNEEQKLYKQNDIYFMLFKLAFKKIKKIKRFTTVSLKFKRTLSFYYFSSYREII
jgi:hypothetical protein